MGKIWLILAAACVALGAPPDTEQTTMGPLKITPIMHGSVMLEVKGLVLHIDPWSKADYSNLPKADVILITDIHGDHMDPAAIAAVKKSSTFIIAPEAVAKTVTDPRAARLFDVNITEQGDPEHKSGRRLGITVRNAAVEGSERIMISEEAATSIGPGAAMRPSPARASVLAWICLMSSPFITTAAPRSALGGSPLGSAARRCFV